MIFLYNLINKLVVLILLLCFLFGVEMIIIFCFGSELIIFKIFLIWVVLEMELLLNLEIFIVYVNFLKKLENCI